MCEETAGEAKGAGKNGPGKNGPGKNGPVKTVRRKQRSFRYGLCGNKGPSNQLPFVTAHNKTSIKSIFLARGRRRRV